MTPSLGDILMATANHYGLTVEEMKGPRRQRFIARARFIFTHIAVSYGFTLPAIGGAMSKDHTSALNGRNQAEELLKDPIWRSDRESIVAKAEALSGNIPFRAKYSNPPVFQTRRAA